MQWVDNTNSQLQWSNSIIKQSSTTLQHLAQHSTEPVSFQSSTVASAQHFSRQPAATSGRGSQRPALQQQAATRHQRQPAASQQPAPSTQPGRSPCMRPGPAQLFTFGFFGFFGSLGWRTENNSFISVLKILEPNFISVLSVRLVRFRFSVISVRFLGSGSFCPGLHMYISKEVGDYMTDLIWYLSVWIISYMFGTLTYLFYFNNIIVNLY
jgi:hypothetical protein